MKRDRESEDAGDLTADVARNAFKKRFGSAPHVPPEVDRLILADARRHFEADGLAEARPTRWRKRRTWQWTAIGTTVAAAGVLFFVMRPQQLPEENRMATTSNAVSADADLMSDVDRNGRVDILDAFAMARQIRGGRDKSYDINHDGRFDETDIDIVAREAVKL